MRVIETVTWFRRNHWKEYRLRLLSIFAAQNIFYGGERERKQFPIILILLERNEKKKHFDVFSEKNRKLASSK